MKGISSQWQKKTRVQVCYLIFSFEFLLQFAFFFFILLEYPGHKMFIIRFVFEAINLLAFPPHAYPAWLICWHFLLMYTHYSPTGEALLILCLTFNLEAYLS